MRDNVRDTALSRAGEPIQLAVASIGADHFGDEDFVYALDILPKLGVPNAELMCWHPRNVTPDGLKRNRQRFLDAGLEPVSVHFLPFRGPGPFHLTTEVANFLWMLHACRELGASVLKFTGASRKADGGLKAAIEVFRHVVPAAEDMGISLVVENHFQNAFEFQEDYEAIFSEIDSPNIGVCLDMGHFASSGVDMVELIEAMPDKIHHIDAKDCRAQGTTDFVRFGDGIVPFDPVISRAVELGFSGYIIVELPRIDKSTMVADLQAGVDLTRKYTSAR
jgi:sugar phosphate isomerase/epimerase